MPEAFERRLGDVAVSQVKTVFGGSVCDNAAGQLAFAKLVNALRQSAGMDISVQSGVLSTPVPNAFALPGGRVYLSDGLLAKAENADEVAGVLAHELGHLRHRDNLRQLIYNGGTSFLIGLLFGDRLGGAGVRLAHVGDGVLFARGRSERRCVCDRNHAQARTAGEADGLMFRVTQATRDSRSRPVIR